MKTTINSSITILFVAAILITILSCKRKEPLESERIQPYAAADANAATMSDSIAIERSLRLTDYDTPPVPLQSPMPSYPEKYRKSGIQGVVLLEVEVDKNGLVDDVKVKRSLLAGKGALDSTAVNAVKNWIFKPATLNQKPVNAKINITIPFTLK